MLCILPTDSLVASARFLISSATIAKPLPDSPALAASMEALRASRLVCSEIASMSAVRAAMSFTELLFLIEVLIEELIFFRYSLVAFFCLFVASFTISAL